MLPARVGLGTQFSPGNFHPDRPNFAPTCTPQYQALSNIYAKQQTSSWQSQSYLQCSDYKCMSFLAKIKLNMFEDCHSVSGSSQGHVRTTRGTTLMDSNSEKKFEVANFLCVASTIRSVLCILRIAALSVSCSLCIILVGCNDHCSF